MATKTKTKNTKQNNCYMSEKQELIRAAFVKLAKKMVAAGLVYDDLVCALNEEVFPNRMKW
jgi:hypothetical protein